MQWKPQLPCPDCQAVNDDMHGLLIWLLWSNMWLLERLPQKQILRMTKRLSEGGLITLASLIVNLNHCFILKLHSPLWTFSLIWHFGQKQSCFWSPYDQDKLQDDSNCALLTLWIPQQGIDHHVTHTYGYLSRVYIEPSKTCESQSSTFLEIMIIASVLNTLFHWPYIL